jgi:hypothetical protein
MDWTPSYDSHVDSMSGTGSVYGASSSPAGDPTEGRASVDWHSGLLTPTASKNHDGVSDSVSELDHTERTWDDRFEEAWRGVL